jgi:hypothetical protein
MSQRIDADTVQRDQDDSGHWRFHSDTDVSASSVIVANAALRGSNALRVADEDQELFGDGIDGLKQIGQRED